MKPLDPKPMKPKSNPQIGADAPAAEAAPAGPPPALSAPPGVAALWHAVARRWLTLLVLGLGLGGAGAAAAWYVVPAKYTAVATVHLDPHPPRGLYEGAEDFVSWRANMALAAHSDPVFRATLDKPEAAELPGVREQGRGALGWFKGEAVVDDKTLDPEALRLTVAADRPEDAAALANLWAQACGETYTAREEAKVKDRIKQLGQNYREATDQLRKKKSELQARRDLLGLEDPRLLDARLQAEQVRQAALQTQHVQTELDVKRLTVRLADLKATLAAPDKLVVADSAVDEEMDKDFPLNPVVKAQVDQLLTLQKKLSERLQALRPEDREGDAGATTYRKGIAEVERTLAAEREQMRPDYEKRLRAKTLDKLRDDAAKAEQELATLKGQQETLEAKLKDGDARIAALRAGGKASGKPNPEVDAMQAEVDEMEAGVKRTGEEQANLEASLPLAPRVTLMEAAAPPAAPDLTKRLRAAGGIFLGLFGLVFVGIAVVEFRARRVYKSQDVSQGLGLPLVGTVPPAKGRTAPAVDDEAMGPMIESMDAIRAMLLHAGRAESLRVLMVASAVAGEGKTSLAANLAASLARGGRRTLLVDGDLRNPAAHQVFGLTAGPGFAELLRGEVEPAQVVQNTSQENLSLLAAGAADRRALQCLAQEGLLRTVFDELKEHYDFLVVDVCPVLPVADALLIGEHADGVLLSVLRNVSRLPAVHAAQQRLTALGIRVLGAVVLGEGLEGYGDVRYPSVAAVRPTAG